MNNDPQGTQEQTNTTDNALRESEDKMMRNFKITITTKKMEEISETEEKVSTLCTSQAS
jgi:hypothetical protein